MTSNKVRVTLTGSYIGCTKGQRATLSALGLRKRDAVRDHATSPAVIGMINVVKHLVTVEPAE